MSAMRTWRTRMSRMALTTKTASTVRVAVVGSSSANRLVNPLPKIRRDVALVELQGAQRQRRQVAAILCTGDRP